jgi:hypothetical protein
MKSHTRTFIEDAIAGGWNPLNLNKTPEARAEIVEMYAHLGQVLKMPILLDPLAWQAVGKTRGWDVSSQSPEMAWLRFGVFANHLFSGLSIEEALAAIS